jgi:microsomal epoxide hydrolase
MPEIAKCYGALMKGLEFNSFIAQGSDIGGVVVDFIGSIFDECKGTPVNCPMTTVTNCLAIHANNKYIRAPPEGTPEYEGMKASGGPKPQDVMKGIMPFAYAMEQGTKPSTAGLVMGCNPMSLLSWQAPL